MRIVRLRIKRFRSFEQIDVPISTITAVVGQNNAGKSGLLRALNAFFHPEVERPFFEDGSHRYTKRSKARIELVFDNLPRRKLITAASHNNTLTIRASWGDRTDEVEYEICRGNRYSPAPSKLLPAVRRYIDFVLVPPHRDPTRLKEEEQALLRRVVYEYLQDKTKRRDTVSPRFRDAAEYLESHQLTALSRSLNDLFGSDSATSLQLTLGDSLSYRNFLSPIDLRIIEGGDQFALENCGTGVQSLAIIALHRALASLQNQNVILGIEEPETNLHPQAQRRFLLGLKEALESPSQESQCVITTHSTVAIDSLSHEDVILIRKSSTEARSIVSSAGSLEPGFWARQQLNTIQYQKYHQYRNSDFFFSKLVLVAESSTDADVFRVLLNRSGIDIDREGIAILNLDGERNLQYALPLLDELSIPRIIVLDKDHFVPYANNDRPNSLDGNGYPMFGNTYKQSAEIDRLVPNAATRAKILSEMSGSQTSLMNLLRPYRTICMRWALEVDLASTAKGKQLMLTKLGLNPATTTTHDLLLTHYTRIKKPDTLLHTITNIPLRSLPRSLSGIVGMVRDELN